jgi:hypothetical protein
MKCTTCKIEKDIINFPRKGSGYRAQCKKCRDKTTTLYVNTEHGYLVGVYNSIKKKVRAARYKNISQEQKEKYRCYMTQEEFNELWEQHKNKHGYKCTLTGIEMILKRKKKTGGTVGYENGFSVDRLNPNIGYTKENTIFITNTANKLKNAVTKELCVSILKAYEERGW